MAKRLNIHAGVESGGRWKYGAYLTVGPFRDAFFDGHTTKTLPLARGDGKNITIARAIKRLEGCIDELRRELST